MQIAIAGFGLEGRANLKYFRAKFPDAEFVIFDENENLTDLSFGVETVLGDDAFSKISGFDLVLRSPSIPPSKIPSDNKKIWSATNEFFAECERSNVQIIGVTGSKGKGTTCSFIYEILKEFFAESSRPEGKIIPRVSPDAMSYIGYGERPRKVWLVGNIGQPSLEILNEIGENDVVVYELSSFQLWDIQFSPRIAVMTLIEPDHLDVHENLADYVEAKANIFKFQKATEIEIDEELTSMGIFACSRDMAVYNQQDALICEIVGEPGPGLILKTGANARPFPDRNFSHFDDEFFYFGGDKLFPISVVKLPGKHNLMNACAAINATWSLTLPEINSNSGSGFENPSEVLASAKLLHSKTIEKGLSNFHGLPHRLQFVREVGGVKFYDDSIATTPGSVIAALKSFDEPKILIVGGRGKGADYSEMARQIDERNVRKVFAIGENRRQIAAAIRGYSDVVVHELDHEKMEEIVGEVWQNSAPGDVVILSPAATSLDMFRDYKDRGEQFAAAVKNLEEN